MEHLETIRIVTADHRELAGLMHQFRAQGTVISAQFTCQELLVHLRLEDEILNPALRSAWTEDTLLLDEADTEHASIRKLIEDLDGRSADDPMLKADMKVLQDQMEQ